MSIDKTAASPAPAAPPPPGAPARRRRLSLKKKLLFAVVVFAIVSVAICLIGEVGLRLFAPQRLMPRYVTDSGFGVRVHCPNIVTRHSTGEYRITIRTNSLGMRADREYPLEKPPGVRRIVTLGDSFTIGYEVEREQGYPYLLEQRLRERGIAVEVLNFGVSGFGTAEELIMLEQRAMKFDPDVVLVGYYNNDIGDNIQSMLYVLDADGHLVRKNATYLPAVKLNNFLYSMPPYRWLTENSHVFCFLRENISELIQKRMRSANAAAADLDDVAERRLTATLLDEIKRVTAAHGAQLCILQIPSITNRSNLPVDELTGVTADEIVDMRPLQQARWDERPLYWQRSDGHWNPAGHALAADALVDHLAPRLVAPSTKAAEPE